MPASNKNANEQKGGWPVISCKLQHKNIKYPWADKSTKLRHLLFILISSLLCTLILIIHEKIAMKKKREKLVNK